MRIFLSLAAIAAFALLGACNVVMTKDPLFTQKDAAGAPVLKPGVWLFFEDPGCKVDESRPFTEWPDCAGGGVVGADDISGPKSKEAKDQIEHMPYVLTAGSPRILQIPVDIGVSAQATASASGDAQVTTSPPSSTELKPYGYGGVEPVKFDDQGRIVAFTLWPVQCGPPPPKNDSAFVTHHPLPGLTVEKDGGICTTASTAALRNAAKASRAWAGDMLRASHWIRDGNR